MAESSPCHVLHRSSETGACFCLCTMCFPPLSSGRWDATKEGVPVSVRLEGGYLSLSRIAKQDVSLTISHTGGGGETWSRDKLVGKPWFFKKVSKFSPSNFP